MSQQLSIFTIAAFNQQNWNAALKKDFGGAIIESCEYDQSIQTLAQLQQKKASLGIYWITERDVEQSMATSFDLTAACMNLQNSFDYNIIILPVVESNHIQYTNLRNELYRLHHQLTSNANNSKMLVLDPTPALMQSGTQAISSSLWYLSKTPYHKNVFVHMARSCKSIWDAWHGQSKKVLILDLDDTLWGGIVGDDGWENLKIGGHDAIGEAFADVQKFVLQLKDQGVVLAICSKNDEKNVWEAFEKHSGMLLNKSDFAVWRINWKDKAENINELIKELNVGMDSVVFIDDNAAERNRIKATFPEILVPEMPDDKMLFPSVLKSLTCFLTFNITEEDKKRTELYQQESQRKDIQKNFLSTDDWIKSLNIEVKFEALNDANLVRAEQLLNKTNQMNLRTRRMTKQELLDWDSHQDHWFFVVHVKDVFGDNGITGLIGFHKENKEIIIDDFVMSCRVMGRNIEHAMLTFILDQANELNCKVKAQYLPTEKNQPIREFFEKVAHKTDKLEYLS